MVEDFLAVHFTKPEYKVCPIHPQVILEIWFEVDRNCYLCAQLSRKAAYAKQKEAANAIKIQNEGGGAGF